MSSRDRYILTGIALLGLLAAFWLVVLGPKRDELRKLDAKVEGSRQSVDAAKQEAEQFAQERLRFPRTYATVVRLGKAAPANPDVPSLLVQLEHAAAQAGVGFRKIDLGSEGGSESGGSSSAASAPPSAPPAGGQPGGATGASGAQSPSATSGSGGASSAATPAGGGAGSATGSSSASASSATGAAPANAQTAATLPIGTVVGPAQLPVLRISMTFQGSFFKLADFVRNIRQLVKKRNRALVVSGRLLTVDAIAFEEGDFGFPQVKAVIAATAYLVPATQGLLAGATLQGPGGAAPTTPAPISDQAGATAPPAAVVSP